MEIELAEEDAAEIERILDNINQIVEAEKPPQLQKKIFANHVLIMICVLFSKGAGDEKELLYL